MTDYTAMNRANWDERVPAHVASPDYAVVRFSADPTFVSRVVEFDRPRLGDVRGIRGVHLQCHIGTDTVSLARLGALMTGVDFSPPAIAAARELAAAAGADVDFVEAEVHDAAGVLGAGGFDLVYTGIGALSWLPSADRWAAVVSALLRPGGRLFLREGHPMLFAIDDQRADELAVRFPYFEEPAPVVYDSELTYVQTDVRFAATRAAVWNHGLGEIVSALLEHGMRITALDEHQSVPWNALPGQMARGEDGEWRLCEGPVRLAASYTLRAEKVAGAAGGVTAGIDNSC
ncbi:MAG: class I SAM-dependent methyltransferase [Nitrososphaerales archaeon]